jgi:hypothetical protein
VKNSFELDSSAQGIDTMNEQTPPPRKSLWRRPIGGVTWYLVSAGITFVIVFAGSLITSPQNALDWGLISWRGFISSTLTMSLLAAGLVVLLLLLGRWLCRWRHLRRVLFVFACLVTLIVLAYTEEDWRGRRAWQRHRRECEARGEEFSIAALVPPPVPDERNFALTPLLRPALDFVRGPQGLIWADSNALARLKRMSAALEPQDARRTNDYLVLGNLERGTFADLSACAEFYRGNTNYPQAAETVSAPERILFALGRFDPELKELREAAVSRPYCRFPIRYDEEPPWAMLFPHLANLKALTCLTYVRATAELETSHSADALEDLKLGLRLSDCIREEPMLINHLVRISALAIDLQIVREGLVRHAWNDAQLALIETNLASLNLLAEYKRAMRGERACSTEGIDFVRRQGFRSNPLAYFDIDNERGVSSLSSGFNPFPSGWFYQNMLTVSRHFEVYSLPAADERARRVFPEVNENGRRAVQQMWPGPYTLLAKMLLPALERVAQRSARMQTYVDTTRVACAMERYRIANRSIPDSLDALVPRFIASIPNDVIDGKPLRFRRQVDGGYLIYSVGWNQTDDGGELASVQKGKETSIDFTKGDWVWELPAR